MPSYYDIDAILAEEELIVVRPSFSFAHLAHLDPDTHRLQSSFSRKRRRDEANKENDVNNSNSDDVDASTGSKWQDQSSGQLPEGTKIKMPLWAVDRWAMLGFIKIPSLPRHYGRRMKERLEADPVSVDLRIKNEHYFLTGMLLTNLLLRASHIAKLHRRTSRSSQAQNAHTAAMEQLSDEAHKLQQSLLTTLLGERLCRNFDWSLSALDNMEDDVSSHAQRLTVLEQKMFERGVEASGAVGAWREFGCSRLGVSLAVVKGRSLGRSMGRVIGTPSANKRGMANLVTPVGADIGTKQGRLF